MATPGVHPGGRSIHHSWSTWPGSATRFVRRHPGKVMDMPMEGCGTGVTGRIPEGQLIPVALITDQKIEMTPWEVHDMAVQVVRDVHLTIGAWS